VPEAGNVHAAATAEATAEATVAAAAGVLAALVAVVDVAAADVLVVGAAAAVGVLAVVAAEVGTKLSCVRLGRNRVPRRAAQVAAFFIFPLILLFIVFPNAQSSIARILLE